MPLPSTPRPSNARVCRRFGHGLRPITAMIMSAAAARDTRTALNAYGGTELAANFPTPKLAPPTSALRTGVTSVNQTPDPGTVAVGPGAQTPRAHVVVELKGSSLDVGAHTVALRWLNPSGTELWSSSGELNVGAPPAGVQEMDLPLIAQIDLPMDAAGGYVMAVSIDGDSASEIPVQVRTSTNVPRAAMLS